ncbi:DUF1592 domain-containing protein [Aporhodopirellula aestuarii]|uniref:DUF1592 domain-containing protein n=1 Tax=Aporhodopirellula aestuarii TaxID=2950107 RepID=A0ABT0TX80_9BACT|nr:DUF1592 domain-containing protein [Aporhodopirellula aestuarii]MCM2369185.1 DUF1592 domain-containing protein [Aporhodopirellula aestuarii]
MMRSRFSYRSWVRPAMIVAALISPPTVLKSTAADSSPAAFLDRYCIECHAADDPSGEREFESLELSKSHVDNQVAIQEIIDQLTLQTMPPDDADQPSTQERLHAINQLTNRLSKMRQQTVSTGGQTVLRRLSNREYRRTIGDLLGIDMTMFDPTIEFPGDNLYGQFDNVGDALVMSEHLMQRYLDAADVCVEKAFAITNQIKPHTWSYSKDFFQQAELNAAHKRAFQSKFICLYDHPFNDKPEGAYGHLSNFPNGVPVDGVYEIRVLAKAMNRDTPYSNKAVRIDLSEPFRMGIRPGDTAIGDMVHTQPIDVKLAETIVSDDDFQWYTFRIPLDRGFAPRFTFENGAHDFRGSIGRVYRLHRDLLPEPAKKAKGIFDQRIQLITYGAMPHIRIDQVEIRGPLNNDELTLSQNLLLGDAEFDESRKMELLTRFAERAFRRPISEDELSRFEAFYQSRRDDGRDATDSFKDTLKAILCSPNFLYFQHSNTAAGLSPHALAERLSYFLTSSMPDEKLRDVADRGELTRADVRRREAKRLLADERSDAFIADFLDSWLGLRSLGSMPPDPNEFWFYYAADLQRDMKTETQMFVRDLINRNASALELIDADYSFINRDLARLYGVEQRVSTESAEVFHRVKFEDRRRGGLLGHASILTVSANGIETSPVIRGVWLLENILGTPTPPPPDNVPAIEPDTRGASTIRDQLSKHRSDATCNQCHRKIDPLGFALEVFDPIGQHRAFYDSKRKKPIDASGQLPGSDPFVGPAGLRRQLLHQKEFFVRTLTEALLTQALGRRIELTDRASIDSILAGLSHDDYPMGDLIESIVASDLFRR